MKKTAAIRIQDGMTEVWIQWLTFDGDDCFNEFRVIVERDRENRRFDFGRWAVHDLRKLTSFFQDPAQLSTGLEFQHPDVRCCDVYRTSGGFRLVVSFQIYAPTIQIEDEFLKEY